MKPLGQDPCQSKLLCNSTPGVARGGFTETPRTRPPRPHQVRASSISKFKLQLELSQFPHMEGTNAMFWRFELPWRGRMLKYLAELAAYVRDVKPDSDVHSNLPKQRSPLEDNGFNPSLLNIDFSRPHRLLNPQEIYPRKRNKHK